MLAIIFGLSMDYEVFLLSRIRERYDVTGDNTAAIASGLQRTGGIITSLALLLVIVVGAFSASGITFIKLMGVGMIIALVVDATIIRVLLVPATMRLLGPGQLVGARAAAAGSTRGTASGNRTRRQRPRPGPSPRPSRCGAEPGTGSPAQGRPSPSAGRPARRRQQFGLRITGPTNAPSVPGATEPYWASFPNALPLGMLPNSHTQLPPTEAWVKYG